MESLDPDTVSKLLHYLELTNQVTMSVTITWTPQPSFFFWWLTGGSSAAQDQTFTMLVLKKNLQASEQFPYPVRVEAVLELIDQFPMRNLEKMTRKGSNSRFDCILHISCITENFNKFFFSPNRPNFK